MISKGLAEEPARATEPDASISGLEGARRQFLVNVSSNMALIIFQSITALWLTPYLIGYLGMAAFGMIPLANVIISYMSVFSNALDSAVSRFLAIEVEKGDKVAANKTFNTAFFGLVGVAIMLSPVALVISMAFPKLFNVPPGWEKDATWLFATVVAAFFVTMITSNFSVSPFIHSQFFLSNLVNAAGILVKIGVIVILFSWLPPCLWYFGGGVLIAGLVTLLGFVILWRKFTPELQLQITAFDRSRVRPLMDMGGWVAVNMVGAMLLSRVDLIVVNAFFGATMTGGYASVIQFSILIDYLATAASAVVRPISLIKYAQQDYAGLQRLSSQSIKLFGLALALPVGLLCGFSRPLLSVWLGPSYQDLSLLLIVIVFHQSLTSSMRPLLHIQQAYNKVRWPGIVTLMTGGVSIILAILLARWGRWGAVGVAVAVAIAWIARNCLYTPIYTALIMKVRWWTFLPNLKVSVIGTLSVGLASYGLTLIEVPDSWLALAGSAALVSLAYGLGVWLIGLSQADRQLLYELSPVHSALTRRIFSAK